MELSKCVHTCKNNYQKAQNTCIFGRFSLRELEFSSTFQKFLVHVSLFLNTTEHKQNNQRI